MTPLRVVYRRHLTASEHEYLTLNQNDLMQSGSLFVYKFGSYGKRNGLNGTSRNSRKSVTEQNIQYTVVQTEKDFEKKRQLNSVH